MSHLAPTFCSGHREYPSSFEAGFSHVFAAQCEEQNRILRRDAVASTLLHRFDPNGDSCNSLYFKRSGIDNVIRKLCVDLGSVSPGVRFAYSGSVAKQTFVPNISDVDILCYNPYWEEHHPQQAIDAIMEVASKIMASQRHTRSVVVGPIDGTWIDLVPTVRLDHSIAIPSPDGEHWPEIHPWSFARELDKVDLWFSGLVKPAIRIVKLAYRAVLSESTLTGHQIEAISQYVCGRNKPQANLLNLFRLIISQAHCAVELSLPDTSGQFDIVDHDLGPIGDLRRRDLIALLRRTSQTILEEEKP